VPLAPDAKVNDGVFDVVVFRNYSKTDFIRHIIGALISRSKLEKLSRSERKEYTHHPKIRTYHAKKVKILTSGRRPWPVHADAQPRGHTPTTIELVPGALRVITGPGEHFTDRPSKGVSKGKPPKHRLNES
jgi:diacylglycerol kinase family enzyme